MALLRRKKKLFPDIGKLEHILKLVSLHTTITIQIEHPEHFSDKSVFG